MSGFVSFVGSGPGDPELLTLKALKRIKNADVILYDDLSAGQILEEASSSAELIGVGKRAGRPSPKQDHVSRLLVEYAQEGGKIVRLKSGDSGIFGRLEEELEALEKAQIQYEIVPGVTSAMAAAAAAGIPLTRRLAARRVQFFTGADITGQLPQDVNWSALADPNATSVVFMGKRSYPALFDGLIAQGLSPQTPAIIAFGVSTDHEKIIHHTLESLKTYLQGTDTPTAALILYGPLKNGGER